MMNTVLLHYLSHHRLGVSHGSIVGAAEIEQEMESFGEETNLEAK